jgi:DNA-directed RNA polymerase subunit M/transcription elongation factor TFIIS
MKFCPTCDNFLYALDDSESGVGFRCRKCPYVETITNQNPLVYEHNLREDTAGRIVANPYLKDDPTLPRFTTIQCPTKGCPSGDVVGVKQDRTNIVWLYQCSTCGVSWSQSARRS